MTWLDEYGRPLADYEVAAIESSHYYNYHDALSYLGFHEEKFEFAEAQAVSCETCGGLFVPYTNYLRKHRRECGWENGPAWVS